MNISQRLKRLEEEIGVKSSTKLKESFSLNTSRFHSLDHEDMQKYFTKELNRKLGTHAEFDGSFIHLDLAEDQENFGENELEKFIEDFSRTYNVEIEKILRGEDGDEDFWGYEIIFYDPNYDGSMMDNYYKNKKK